MNRATVPACRSFQPGDPNGGYVMRKILLALSGVAVAAAVAPIAPANAKTYVCTKWDSGVCVSTHRVKGRPAYAVGYVFGPNYAYTTVGALPQPVVTYDNLTASNRYVYS